MKYLKYAFLCFLLFPMAANANKYTLRGKNTKAEVIALGLEVRDASQERGVNQINAKAKVLTYEITNVNFEPCQPSKISITFFVPPKGVLFSAELAESRKETYQFQVRDSEVDGLLVGVKCPNNKSYVFALVD